jgi:tRNA-dihydrouridine synthase
MKIYLAPLEGITNSIYRTALHEHFGGVDRYFTPFITPSAKGVLGARILRDVLPENNDGQEVIPQILTDSAEGFLTMCKRLSQFGYTEFNLNLGCPSGTVVSKGRGSGFLAFPEELDRFLDEIFKSDYKISVKTRIGKENPDEFYRLLEIYNKYPMTELIIHPRTRADMYGNHPNLDMYQYAVEHSKTKLCYNGDIFNMEYYNDFTSKMPMVDTIMIGRGAVINPALPRLLKTGKAVTADELKAFYNDLYTKYSTILSGGTQLMHKMKEVITYMLFSFEDSEKIGRKIKKSKNLRDFDAAITELFNTHRLK